LFSLVFRERERERERERNAKERHVINTFFFFWRFADNDDLFNQLSLGFQRVVAIVNTTDALHQQIAGTELALARSQTQYVSTQTPIGD